MTYSLVNKESPDWLLLASLPFVENMAGLETGLDVEDGVCRKA